MLVSFDRGLLFEEMKFFVSSSMSENSESPEMFDSSSLNSSRFSELVLAV